MKRLFYSTVAVLAFSVSGMANTIELEDLVIDKENMSYCEDRSLIVGIEASEEYPDATDEEITWFMNVALAHCMGYSLKQIYEVYPYPGW
jgi:hypothetical protein